MTEMPQRGNQMESALPPWFPAWGIEFHSDVEDARVQAAILLEARPDERWLLIGYPVGISERWLWAVWLALRERVLTNKMVSRTLDGEFLRLIAGTHQMKVAFHAAGLRPGERRAWLLRIPEWPQTGESDDITLPIDDYLTYSRQAAELMAWMEADLITERPAPNRELFSRLEIADGSVLGSDGDEIKSDLPPEVLLMGRLSMTDID